MDNNQPATGQYTITVNYYTAGATTPIHSETFTNANVQNGIFNVVLGSSNPFPATMDFTEQYFIGVQVNGAPELQPRTAMLSAPYALNANTINGFSVSGVPAAGQLLVLDNSGRVPASALPAGPTFLAGSNIVIQQDTLNNTYTFSSTGGTGTGITSIIANNGLFGGGSTGDVTIGIAPNAITSDMIAAGSITGTKLSPTLAGEGLYQDILGNLNVGVDNASIVISDDRLMVGTLGAAQLDSTVQRRITGIAAPGSFITGVDNTGGVTTATVTTDNSLTRTITGNDVNLAINPANSNTFTAPQNFDVINANTVNTQDLNTTRNVVLGNGTNSNLTINPGTGVIDLSGARIQNVGLPTAGTDVVTRDFLTSEMNNQVFGGDVAGNFGNLQLNTANPGIGDRLIQGVNTGTSGQIVDAVINDDLTINGGTIDNTIIGATTPNSATFTDVTIQNNLTVNGSATFGDGTAANTFVFNTNGGSISLSGATLQGVGDPVLGTDAVNLNYLNNQMMNQTFAGDITGTPGAIEIDPTNAGIGDRLITGINAGTTTINNAAVADDLTINGGTVDNTPIGATTASSGSFSTLNSSGQTMLATATGDVVIGTAAPVNTGAILEIERAQADDLLTRIYNTGAGGSELRLIGNNGVQSTLAFTDADEYVSSINSNDATGLTFNVRNTTDVNSEAGLDAAVAMTIERDRDVVIEEDLTVNGALNFGNGDDEITFNAGTGNVNFMGSRLQNVADPVAGTDAVNLNTLNNATAAQTFAGDITGTPSTITLDPTNAGIGDRLITGINNGTTTINDAVVGDALTVNGGTIDNTPIGATTASSGNFTTLNSTGQTQVATAAGNLVVGTATPLENDAIIQVQRAQAGDLLQRIYNTGAGGAELRLAGASGVTNTLGFTDDNEWLASVNANDGVGMTFNVRDVAETNTEAGLDAAVAMTIERDRDVVINEDLTVGGTLTVGNGTFTGSTFGISGGDITSTAAPTGTTSNRFADTYTVPAGSYGTVTINNSLVTTGSTVLVTFEDNTGGTSPTYTVQTDSNGSFDVVFSGATADGGDEIHYMIINH